MKRISIACFLVSLLSGPPLAAADASSPPAPGQYEGDWYVSDITDNITGEREVYAFATYLKKDDPDYVTVKMRCANNAPVVAVEWDNLDFPSQTVVTFTLMSSEGKFREEPYIFEKSTDPIRRGLHATPAVSLTIVTALAKTTLTTISAHISAQPRSVIMSIEGIQKAWSRVARHCPAPIMPLPPQ